MTTQDLQTRLGLVEARLEIGQLPIRYALAVDQRDIDAWVDLFVPDVRMGARGSGREALKSYIEPQLRWFYRSVHQICGHRIELGPAGPDGLPTTATGQVYCRAEHEVGERWIVMALRYDDSYQLVDGSWYFTRRRDRHWYAADIVDHPQAVQFDSWGAPPDAPGLPAVDRSWGAFWNGTDTSALTGGTLRTMRVGLYFDMRNPARWRRDPTELYGTFLELCEEAEHLGIDSIWVTEHHGFDDDYLPAPLTLLAAVAARTRRVRLGTGIVVAPLHPAAEIAEQAAVVDVLSGGRLDLGLGAGYRPPEFDLYGADITTRYRENDARARQVRELWRTGAVTPAPVQEPVPIWMGYLGPQGARRAGLLGEHLLSPDARNWAPYREALVEAGHDPATARMGGGIQGWVCDDPERDWPVVAEHLAFQVDSYRRHGRMGYDLPPAKPVDPERLRSRRPQARTATDYFVHGTPADMAAFLDDHTGDAPVDTVYLWAGLPGMSADLVARHIRTIATELCPLLADEPGS